MQQNGLISLLLTLRCQPCSGGVLVCLASPFVSFCCHGFGGAVRAGSFKFPGLQYKGGAGLLSIYEYLDCPGGFAALCPVHGSDLVHRILVAFCPGGRKLGRREVGYGKKRRHPHRDRGHR